MQKQKKIKKDFKKLRDRLSKSKIKETRKDLYRIVKEKQMKIKGDKRRLKKP